MNKDKLRIYLYWAVLILGAVLLMVMITNNPQ
jgi:hypothetical protein